MIFDTFGVIQHRDIPRQTAMNYHGNHGLIHQWIIQWINVVDPVLNDSWRKLRLIDCSVSVRVGTEVSSREGACQGYAHPNKRQLVVLVTFLGRHDCHMTLESLEYAHLHVFVLFLLDLGWMGCWTRKNDGKVLAFRRWAMAPILRQVII